MRNLTERIDDASKIFLKSEMLNEEMTVKRNGILEYTVGRLLTKVGLASSISLGREERKLVDPSIKSWDRLQARTDVFKHKLPHPLDRDDWYYERASERVFLPGLQEDIKGFLDGRFARRGVREVPETVFVQVGMRGNVGEGDQFFSVRFFDHSGLTEDRESGLLADCGGRVDSFENMNELDKALFVSLVEAIHEQQQDASPLLKSPYEHPFDTNGIFN